VCTLRQGFVVVGVCVFQGGEHTGFQGGFDVCVEPVTYVNYVFRLKRQALGCDFEDSRVGFAKFELVGIYRGVEEFQDF